MAAKSLAWPDPRARNGHSAVRAHLPVVALRRAFQPLYQLDPLAARSHPQGRDRRFASPGLLRLFALRHRGLWRRGVDDSLPEHHCRRARRLLRLSAGTRAVLGSGWSDECRAVRGGRAARAVQSGRPRLLPHDARFDRVHVAGGAYPAQPSLTVADPNAGDVRPGRDRDQLSTLFRPIN